MKNPPIIVIHKNQQNMKYPPILVNIATKHYITAKHKQ